MVSTVHFGETPPLSGADRNLKVTEWFTRRGDEGLLYRFRVEDPTVWTRPWSGEYFWPASPSKVYEYACHEGNYALGNVMRGARALEREAGAASR